MSGESIILSGEVERGRMVRIRGFMRDFLL